MMSLRFEAHIGEYLIKAPPTCIPGFVTDLVKPYFTLGEKNLMIY